MSDQTICRGILLAVLLVTTATTRAAALQQPPAAGSYQELIELFTEWREFQRPGLQDGVPDYSAVAMATQHRALPAFQRRLAVIDTAGWTRAQQVDWHIVGAEMNGLDFDHRVLRPWANNPAFYVTVFPGRSDQPAREGPHAEGALELWSYTFPLSRNDAADVAARLRIIPGLLEGARANLVGAGKDLWTMGIRSIAGQSSALESLAARVARNAELAAEVARARRATDEFRVWLESQAPSKSGQSGIGIDRYDWYLKNVQLVPYTWQDQVTLMKRELGRARAALSLEEHKNRGLPPHRLIADSAQWARQFDAAVTEYMAFLEEYPVLTVRDYMEPALRARRGRFSAAPREFFTEVNYRDAIVMRTHDFHWIDLAQMEMEPHESPIRRGPLLYNIFITRTEGLATALEEMLTHAGFLDEHPRGKELIYILVAQRAARALGDLMMHANQFTIEEAVEFTSAQTPRGWLERAGRTVWGEQHLYLQQPAYGTSYLIGKQEIERLLSDRAQQLGPAFTLKRFMDELTDVGMIPMSLVRYELLGELEIQ